MASLVQRIQMFLRTPKGQRLLQQGRQQLAKPENQARARSILAKLQGRRR